MAPKPCKMMSQAGKSECIKKVKSGKGDIVRAGKGDGMKKVKSGKGKNTGTGRGVVQVTDKAVKKPAALKRGSAAFKAAKQKIAVKAAAAAERLRQKGIALIVSGAFWR